MVDRKSITIDDRSLLERTALNFQQNAEASAEMPAHLTAAQIPIKEVLKPSKFGSDPLRQHNLYRKSLAFFTMPLTASPRIFHLHVAPSIGDKEEIENTEKQVKQAKAAPAKEKEIMLKLLQTLKETETDFQEIANRLKEFVLG